ncbi:MAG: hypothetical protein GXP14_06340 [Gammaproteobacteria bacterium]|nr:hypothetical protein [Gammaproteobacteria bacterium]
MKSGKVPFSRVERSEASAVVLEQEVIASSEVASASVLSADPTRGLQQDRTLAAQLMRVALAYVMVVGTWMFLSSNYASNDNGVLTVKTETPSEVRVTIPEVNSEIRVSIPEANLEIRATIPEIFLREHEKIQTNI